MADLLRNHFVSEADDDPVVRQQAGHQGWRIDKDGWYMRRRRAGDIDISGAEHFGFTTEAAVYVRTCAQALLYDKGIIT